MAYVPYSSKCKVCNSQMRTFIQELYVSGLSPEKIWEYLQNIDDPIKAEIIQNENISSAAIRRHLNNHFDTEQEAKIKAAESKAKLETNRTKYQQGIDIVVNKINSLNYLIEKNIILIEELEGKPENYKTKYSAIAQLVNSTKGLVETVSKLTGDLKQEGTIDIAYFNTEISGFADIVISTIYQIDKQLDLDGKLNEAFVNEFKRQWDLKQQHIQNLTGGNN